MGIGLFFKKIFALSLALFFLFPTAISFFPTANATESTEQTEVYSKLSTGRIFAIGRKSVATVSPTGVETDFDNFDITSEISENSSGISITPKTDGAKWPVSVTVNKKTSIDISNYNELFFRVNFSGVSVKTLNFEITLSTDDGNFSAEGSVKAGADYDVFVPISVFGKVDAVNAFTVTFSSSSEVSQIKLSTIYADDGYSYEHIERFSAERFSSDIGIEVFEKELLPTVKDGSAEFHSSITSESTETSNTMTALVTVSGAKSGTMTLSVKNTSKNDITDVATVTLSEGQNSYPFVFDSSSGTNFYRLSFSGITESDGERLTVHSVGFSMFGEKLFSKGENAGSILSCTSSADFSKIQIEGTLRSSTVAENMKASLGIVAEDIWQSDVTEVLATKDMSTVFSFSFSTEKLKLNPSFYKFYLVMINGDDVQKLSSGTYPTVASPNVKSGKTPLGIQSDDSSASFTSNASHTVVDVYLDKLESKDGTGGRLHSYGGGYKYIANSYVGEIDEKINFALKSGVQTYIRILESTSPDTGSDISNAYSFNASDYSLSMRYMTLIDFISSRYVGVAGYIIGTRANNRDFNYCNVNSLISYAENYALILRMTSVTVRANTSDAFISVAIGDGYTGSRQRTVARNLSYGEFTGIGEYSYSPILYSSVLSHAISNAGSFNWYITYECESAPESAADNAYGIYSSLVQGTGSTPSGYMLFWQPEDTVSTEKIAESAVSVFDKCTKYGIRAAVLSLTKQNSDMTDIIDAVSSADIGGTDRCLVKGACSVEIATDVKKNSLALWDFKNSYSVKGFISAGNVTSLTTEFSSHVRDGEALGIRVLHGKLNGSAGKSGTVLSYFDSPIEPKSLDSIDITVYIESEKSNFVSVISTLGSGNKHYEYETSVPTERAVTLSLYPDILPDGESIDYIALSFESGDDAEFDVFEISAVSKGSSAEDISAKIGLTESEAETENYITDTVIITGSAIVITAVVFTSLSIKQESSRKEKEKEKR